MNLVPPVQEGQALERLQGNGRQRPFVVLLRVIVALVAASAPALFCGWMDGRMDIIGGVGAVWHVCVT